MNKFNELKERLNRVDILTKEDEEKVKVIKGLFLNENCFFDLEMTVALNILLFLGIKKEDLIDYYHELISPENYMNVPKVMNVNTNTNIK